MLSIVTFTFFLFVTDASSESKPKNRLSSLAAFCNPGSGLIPDDTIITLEKDELVGCRVILPSNFELEGSGHRITLTDAGGFRAIKSRNLSFRNTRFLYSSSSIESASPTGARSLFIFEGASSLSFANNQITVDIPTKPATQETLASGFPLGRIVTLFRWIGDNTFIKLENNQFKSKGMYTARLMSGDEKEESKRYWEVLNNSFSGFHGVVYADFCESCKIEGNTFRLNSYNNIVVSGSNIEVGYNDIFSPGAGSDGDGIAILNVRNIHIFSNTISYASGYGMWFRGTANAVLVERNVITSGNSTALAFGGVISPNASNFTNVTVKANTFVGNGWWGVGVEGADGFRLEGNYFVANKYPGFSIPPSASHQVVNAHVVITKNYNASSPIPTSATHLQYLETLPEIIIP